MPQSLFQDWTGEPRTYTRQCVIRPWRLFMDWIQFPVIFFTLTFITATTGCRTAFTQPAGVILCSISGIQSSYVVWHKFLNGFFHDTMGALMYSCNCHRASFPLLIEWHLYVSKTRSLSAKDGWPKITCIPFICRHTLLAVKFCTTYWE